MQSSVRGLFCISKIFMRKWLDAETLFFFFSNAIANAATELLVHIGLRLKSRWKAVEPAGIG